MKPELERTGTDLLCGSAITAAHGERLRKILRMIELSTLQQIPKLAKLPNLDLERGPLSNTGVARSLLVEQRTSEPGYRQPEKKIRRIFWTSSRRNLKSHREKWSFAKHEVAKAFENLLSRTPLPAPETAQALLDQIGPISVEDLWYHLADPELQRRTDSLFRRSRTSLTPDSPWLDRVTSQGNLEYIRLMCQSNVSPQMLNRALGIALSNNLMGAMKILLSFGASASASAYQDIIRQRFVRNDVAFAKLLLSAPGAMSVESWRYCLKPDQERFQAHGKMSTDILHLCLTHCPEVACVSLLVDALKLQNIQATAIILAYAGADEDFQDVRQVACELATRIEDSVRRYQMFEVLAEAGLVKDGRLLHGELLRDVKAHELPLIQLLVRIGITLDAESYNAVAWAVANMKLDIIQLFANGKFSSPISRALAWVPESVSDAETLHLVETLAPRGLLGEPLDSHLIRAVRRKQTKVIGMLLRYGASIEFQHASAVQTALEIADFDILNALLQAKCSPEILSHTVPTAMGLTPRLTRRKAVTALVGKGVLTQELSTAMHTLVSEDGGMDTELTCLLLERNVFVDNIDDDAKNPVLVAAKEGNLAVLKMLCGAKPRIETLSKAVPIVFDAIQACGYRKVYNMIKLLLETGAAGLPVQRVLLSAAKQDHELEIVSLLVHHHADANYANGGSFAVALETGNLELLEILCRGCSPSEANLKTLLLTAISPRYYSVRGLELLLNSNSSSPTVLNNIATSAEFRSSEKLTELFPCCVRHGLDINLDNGFLLCFAVQEMNLILLRTLLSANPNIASLKTAFLVASSLQLEKIQLEVISLLLEQAESADIGQSKLVLQYTITALAGDKVGLQLLLRHNASVDLDDGRAVNMAAMKSSEVLHLLLSAGPDSSTIKRACLTVASASLISPGQKKSVLGSLIAANEGLSSDEMSKLLHDSVATLPVHTHLPQQLIARRAEIRVKTLKLALGIASYELLLLLIRSVRNTSKMVKMFRHARRTTMVPTRRYWIYEHLLANANDDVPKEDISKALIHFLETKNPADMSVPKLLLDKGADVGYKDSKAFSLALKANCLEAVKLLSQYIVDDRMAGIIFDRAREVSFPDVHIRAGIYRCLLQWNIKESSLYYALVEDLEGNHSDNSIAAILVAKGADPNKEEARCFDLVAQSGAQLKLGTLSPYMKPRTLLKMLLKQPYTEKEVITRFTAYIEEQTKPVQLESQELLFQCMSIFPKGNTLLKLLLNLGIPTSGMINHRLCANWVPEPCSALIWALLSSKPRIENEAILTLVEHWGNTGLSAYTTPRSRVSAAFACLLDKSRTDVLKALLSLDQDQILDYKVPGTTLGHLGAHSEHYDRENRVLAAELPLREASLHLGNFEAFRLLSPTEIPNDTTLHLAALIALPKFVAYLLPFHNPHYTDNDYDNMIPLALACASRPEPWCKIANEEVDWATRQRETMRLLTFEMDPAWRSHGRTILHIAIDNGLDATKAMIAALGFCHDTDRGEKYVYVDRKGRRYSPAQYVMLDPDVKEEEKTALVECLQAPCLHEPFRLFGLMARRRVSSLVSITEA